MGHPTCWSSLDYNYGFLKILPALQWKNFSNSIVKDRSHRGLRPLRPDVKLRIAKSDPGPDSSEMSHITHATGTFSCIRRSQSRPTSD
jgi:hypothetical protein